MKKGGKLTIFQNRTGSHVGMILSFVIFITFILFLYTVIKPAINIGEDKTTTLQYIEGRIEENVSSNFTKVGLQIRGINPGPRCIQLLNFLAWPEIGTPIYSAIVKNETGGIQEAYSGSGSSFANLVINRGNRNNLFFEVDFSSVFAELSANTIPSCTVTGNYNISLVRTEKYVYEKSMYNLINYYKDNYENLKRELKVPPGNEFGFGFKQSNGTVIEIGGRGVANIYATETPVQYFDDKATIQSGFINVKVW